MAEYIDREVAKKMLDEYRISRTMSMYGDMDLLMEWREGVKCSMKKLDEVPTADVVPKSEVEKLKSDLIVWKQDRFNLYQRLELYEMARQKVAREIFADMKKCLWQRFSDEVEGEYRITEEDFAELKKKYPGEKECPNCRYFVGCECFDGKTCDEYEEKKE